VAALRLCIDRICPPQRRRPVALALPEMTAAKDAVVAMSAIMQAIGDGDPGAEEAAEQGDRQLRPHDRHHGARAAALRHRENNRVLEEVTCEQEATARRCG